MKYICTVCGYIYNESDGDPSRGVLPGTKWDELPSDFTCPICGADRGEFAARA